MNSAIYNRDQPIFPMVKITHNHGEVRIETYLRRLHTDGKYYLQFCMKRTEEQYQFKNDSQWLRIFYAEVYGNMIIGIVQPEVMIAHTEDPAYDLDENQEPESERLEKVLNLGLNLKTKTEDENRQD